VRALRTGPAERERYAGGLAVRGDQDRHAGAALQQGTGWPRSRGAVGARRGVITILRVPGGVIEPPNVSA